MSTVAAPPITPDDLLRMPDQGKGYELVDGELKEISVSYLSRFVAGRAFARINQYVEQGNSG